MCWSLSRKSGMVLFKTLSQKKQIGPQSFPGNELDLDDQELPSIELQSSL